MTKEITTLTAGRSFKQACSQCGQQFRAHPCGISHTAIKAALMIRAKARKRKASR